VASAVGVTVVAVRRARNYVTESGLAALALCGLRWLPQTKSAATTVLGKSAPTSSLVVILAGESLSTTQRVLI